MRRTESQAPKSSGQFRRRSIELLLQDKPRRSKMKKSSYSEAQIVSILKEAENWVRASRAQKTR
jgi:hypothetical protein